MSQFSNNAATHPCTNEVEVTPRVRALESRHCRRIVIEMNFLQHVGGNWPHMQLPSPFLQNSFEDVELLVRVGVVAPLMLMKL